MALAKHRFDLFFDGLVQFRRRRARSGNQTVAFQTGISASEIGIEPLVRQARKEFLHSIVAIVRDGCELRSKMQADVLQQTLRMERSRKNQHIGAKQGLYDFFGIRKRISKSQFFSGAIKKRFSVTWVQAL